MSPLLATFASTDTAARIVITDGTDTGYVNVSSGKVSLGQALGLSGNNLNIDASGNVGIGVTSSASNYSRVLHLHNTSTGSALHLTDGTSGSGANDGTDLLHYGTDTYITNRETTGNTRFFNGGSEAMRINSSGQVGIGTVSPSAKLDTAYTDTATYSATSPSADLILSRKNTGNTANETVGIRFDITGWSGSTTGGAAIEAIQPSNASTADLAFLTRDAGTWGERMRITSDGNLLVGKAASDVSVNGFEADNNGYTKITRTSGTANVNTVLQLNRLSTDGEILRLQQDGTTVGSIGNENSLGVNSIYLVSALGTGITFGSAAFIPTDGNGNAIDNSKDLGASSLRFDDVYATNGTIQTSDRNEKQDIEALSDAEQRVAVACKGLLRKFRWKSSVEEKGDDARIHFGIIAQDLQDAFTAEGLDAGRYAMFINSTWTDEETGEERSRMGVRYSELLAFIIAAI